MGQSESSNLFTVPRPSTSIPGPNNLPPLQFHQVHGDNIRICKDGTMAKRYESFCKGITFSARPVKVYERVYVKFSEMSNNWSGVIRFGFTYNDPVTLRNSLPKYACPDLTNKPGYWAKALNERFCEKDYILFFYVTTAGDVHFGLNGEEKGIFIHGVETRRPLWTLIDIYGNCSAIEFLDSRYIYNQKQHINPRRSIITPPDVDRVIPAMQSLSVNEESPSVVVNRPSISASNGLVPMPFHHAKGRNVMLTQDRLIATRADTEFCQGYVFTARPLQIGETIVVQILRTEHMYLGALALGLTSCDPATLQPSDLPDDSDMLLDRPEYWVVSKDVASTPVRGDEISFCVTQNGEVKISKNGGPATVVMHVDQSLQLWAFLDVYGSTQSVRMLSRPVATATNPAVSPRRLQVRLPTFESINSLNSMVSTESQRKNAQPAMAQSRVINVPATSDNMIQLQPGGTVLVVNLPPAQSNLVDSDHVQARLQPQSTAVTPSSSSSLVPGYSNAYIEPISSQLMTALRQDPSQVNHVTGAECTICYENPIDSVLYMCGHMCMCYECARKQWQGIGGGHCPLCRAVIRDVIRTYKS